MANYSLQQLLIPSILAGLIPAVIARHKGGKFFIWWIYGIASFLLVEIWWYAIALYLTCIIHSVYLKPTEAKMLASGMIKCPFCAELIKPETKVCRYCGKDQIAKENVEKKAARNFRKGKATESSTKKQQPAEMFKQLPWEAYREAIQLGTKIIQPNIRNCEVVEIDDEKQTIIAVGTYARYEYQYIWTPNILQFSAVNAGRILLDDNKSYVPFTTDYIIPASEKQPNVVEENTIALKQAQDHKPQIFQ